MKKSRTIKAFSLAEAMITLLIVCLITLASIPVITKKKRSPDNNAHGAYYCSKRWNETTQKYDLVHFSTINPVGDMDNINTWELVGGSDEYCKFVPPLNASNFAVTLIGGGGAGAKGVSRHEQKLGGWTYAYTPTAAEAGIEHYLVMVGGGGGGANGTKYYNDYMESVKYGSKAGRSGGAGGAWAGKVKLHAGTEYSFKIGSGGNRYNGSIDDDPAEWAADGEGTFLYFRDNRISGTTDSIPLLIAGGGQGGQQMICDTTCIDDGCWGANGGQGGVNRQHVMGLGFLNTVLPGYSNLQNIIGSNGTTVHDGSIAYGGKSLGGKGFKYNGVEYGRGGDGAYASRNKFEQNGSPGYFSLALIRKNGGQGGFAGENESQLIPKIPGHLRLYVGEGGVSTNDYDSNGGNSKAAVYNKANVFVRQYTAQGGNAGARLVNIDSTNGDNSLWTAKGGGARGSCGKLESDAVESKIIGYETVKTNKCLKVIGIKARSDMSLYDEFLNAMAPLTYESSYRKIFAMQGLDNWQSVGGLNPSDIYEDCSVILPEALTLDTNQNKALVKTGMATATIGDIKRDMMINNTCLYANYCSPNKAAKKIHELGLYIDSEDEDITTAAAKLNSEDNFLCAYNISADNTEFMDKYQAFKDTEQQPEHYQAFWNYIKDTKEDGYFKYKTYWAAIMQSIPSDTPYVVPTVNVPTFTYQCFEQEQVVQPIYETEVIAKAGQEYCEPGSRGTSFGAGGGGGGASEVPDHDSLGGRGAAGAVIVEW